MGDRFDLSKAIATWRQFQVRSHGFLEEDIDELEVHLRAHMAELRKQDWAEERAFREAVRSLGDLKEAKVEYRKIQWSKLKHRHKLTDELTWRGSMLKNYVKVALRTLRRQKGYSFLNIAGLTLGMACCLSLFQYVAYETSYDQFNTNKDRIYRAAFDMKQRDVDQGLSILTGYIFGETMAGDIPGITRYTRYHPSYGDAVLSYSSNEEEKIFTERASLFVDSTFLGMFDYPLIHGDRSQVLRTPQHLLLSESTANKYFGDEEAIGKVVEFTGWVQGLYIVEGVFEDVPSNSHLQFDVLLPIEDLLRDGRFDEGDSPWRWANFVTYFQLAPQVEVAKIEEQITEAYSRYQAERFARNQIQATSYLEPLTEIHLNGHWAPSTQVGNRRTVYFLTLLGLIILVIALINYVNLATARAMDRAREVGVRKAIGAQKQQLLGQFLMESSLINMLALLFAIVLSLVMLPVVGRIAGVDIPIDLWLDSRFLMALLSIFSIGALLSGLYPAFMLSSFQTVTVLKGKVSLMPSRLSLRKGLIVLQFAASIALLAGTLFVYSQLKHMQSMDTGMDMDQVVIIEEPKVGIEESGDFAAMSALKHELQNIPSVEQVGISRSIPGWGYDSYSRVYRADADPSTSQAVGVTSVDVDFTSVYDLGLTEGDNFRVEMASADNGSMEVVVNETLIQSLGFASNKDAIGEWIQVGERDAPLQIRGVLEDFMWASARHKTDGVIFWYDEGKGHLHIKINTTNLTETIAAIETTYKTHFPGNPFNYHFADAIFDGYYQSDKRFATLFSGFGAIAMLVACLGLFGLASFTIQQRTKEIGVRKVLGASVSSIVTLLSKEFLILVAVAFFVAVPLTFLSIQNWLEGFANKIEIGPGNFLIAGALVVLIALLTVSYQTIKAAFADPVKSMRYE